MRIRLIAFLTAGLLALGAGSALAAPGGNEDSNNQVTCDKTNPGADGNYAYAGTEGAGICNETGTIQGRIYVKSSGSAAIDGDSSNADNGAPTGFARVDSNGLSCGDGDSESSETRACG
ncbi:MAG: hypothetical protein ACR2H3_05920 [Acidimicrobiales bacterium]